MEKIVFKGWISKNQPLKDVIYWSIDPFVKEWSWLRIVEMVFAKQKGKRHEWGNGKSWPPRRVTVTVEVED